ncbi:Cytochrome P450 4V2 [Orchesella cincta]|uniref:Cytochrome P450 4V2 n=1 Tax=Orchesella cincta TaxID=48709 RepID=A0A1D2M239_ORCCI|nr:Cytochrome P450 4V2 [Orchesella cincta]
MKKCLKLFENWCGKYGPVFTLNFGPYSLTVLNSPEYIQKLLGSKDMDYFGKGFIYKPFKPYWQDGLLTSKGEKWKFRRKLLERHIFSFKTLTGYMSIFNEEGDKLVKQMEEIFLDGSEKGIEELLMSASLEIITSATLGKTVAELEAATNVDITFPSAINQAKEIIAKRSKEPWLLIDFIWRLHPLSKVEKRCQKTDGCHLIKNSEQNRQIGIGINEALLSAGVPVEGVFEESITLICAGYETTASCLHFLLLFLALHPHHQELCREEVDSIFEDEDLCPSGQLQFKALSKLKHLEMCVFETLRLLPTVFLIMRKIEKPLMLEEDLHLDTGSQVMIFVQGLHKNPKYFPNPEKFIPERFSDEETKARHSYAYIPFAGGQRKCIGYKFAMLEVITLSAKLLRHFVWESE